MLSCAPSPEGAVTVLTAEEVLPPEGREMAKRGERLWVPIPTDPIGQHQHHFPLPNACHRTKRKILYLPTSGCEPGEQTEPANLKC